MPYATITNVTIDENRKKVILQIGNIEKSFKYQMKDCFGSNQDEQPRAFFR